MIRNLLAVTTVIGGLTFVHSAFAQMESTSEGQVGQSSTRTLPRPTPITELSQRKPHVGLITGFADTGNSYDSSVNYGIDAGFQPYIPFGVGVELSRFTTDRGNADGRDLTRTKLLVRGTYNLGGTTPFLRYTWGGLAAGPVFDDLRGDSTTVFGWAPMVGFDIPITDENAAARFSLGANASYLFTGGSRADTFAMNGTLKLWFQ